MIITTRPGKRSELVNKAIEFLHSRIHGSQIVLPDFAWNDNENSFEQTEATRRLYRKFRQAIGSNPITVVQGSSNRCTDVSGVIYLTHSALDNYLFLREWVHTPMKVSGKKVPENLVYLDPNLLSVLCEYVNDKRSYIQLRSIGSFFYTESNRTYCFKHCQFAMRAVSWEKGVERAAVSERKRVDFFRKYSTAFAHITNLRIIIDDHAERTMKSLKPAIFGMFESSRAMTNLAKLSCRLVWTSVDDPKRDDLLEELPLVSNPFNRPNQPLQELDFFCNQDYGQSELEWTNGKFINALRNRWPTEKFIFGYTNLSKTSHARILLNHCTSKYIRLTGNGRGPDADEAGPKEVTLKCEELVWHRANAKSFQEVFKASGKQLKKLEFSLLDGFRDEITTQKITQAFPMLTSFIFHGRIDAILLGPSPSWYLKCISDLLESPILQTFYCYVETDLALKERIVDGLKANRTLKRLTIRTAVARRDSMEKDHCLQWKRIMEAILYHPALSYVSLIDTAMTRGMFDLLRTKYQRELLIRGAHVLDDTWEHVLQANLPDSQWYTHLSNSSTYIIDFPSNN